MQSPFYLEFLFKMTCEIALTWGLCPLFERNKIAYDPQKCLQKRTKFKTKCNFRYQVENGAFELNCLVIQLQLHYLSHYDF